MSKTETLLITIRGYCLKKIKNKGCRELINQLIVHYHCLTILFTTVATPLTAVFLCVRSCVRIYVCNVAVSSSAE